MGALFELFWWSAAEAKSECGQPGREATPKKKIENRELDKIEKAAFPNMPLFCIM